MGRFTGKSDFEDWCEMHNRPEDIIANAKVYINDAKVDIKTPEDLIPFYTHLTACIASSEGKQTIHLSMESFIDMEEKELLEWRIVELIKVARKAKKYKVPFNYEYVCKERPFLVFSPSRPGQEAVDLDKATHMGLIARINEKPEIIKYHLPTDYRQRGRFVYGYLIPEYFADIHLRRFNQQRKDFLKYCMDYGYPYDPDEKGVTYIKDSGKLYSPVLLSIWFKVKNYEKLEDNFGGN